MLVFWAILMVANSRTLCVAIYTAICVESKIVRYFIFTWFIFKLRFNHFFGFHSHQHRILLVTYITFETCNPLTKGNPPKRVLSFCYEVCLTLGNSRCQCVNWIVCVYFVLLDLRSSPTVLSTHLLVALSKPVTPIKSTHKQILLHHYHLYHRTISGEKRCMCFWWRWGESNSRPRPVSLCFIQQ